MDTIHKTLGMTAEEYNDFYFHRYWSWCMSYSINLGSDLQKIFANAAISKWYKKEFEKLEAKFLRDLKPFGSHAQKCDITNLYFMSVGDIYSIYPKPLFEVARKISISNDIGAN